MAVLTIAKLKQNRQNMIQIVYRFFLLPKKTRIEQEILDDTQLDNVTERDKKDLFRLLDFIPVCQNAIEKNLADDWKWSRIPKIIQAILIVGVFEVKELHNHKAVVINECVNLTREYLPSWDERFVNAVLDNTLKDV